MCEWGLTMARIENLENFGARAENLGIYAVDSDVGGVMFLAKDDEFGIATHDGIIRFKRKDLDTILEEIKLIENDLRYRDQCDLELMGVGAGTRKKKVDEMRLALMLKAGWGNTEIAEALGISISSVNKWKRRKIAEGCL